MAAPFDTATMARIIGYQREEETGSAIYYRMAMREANPQNRAVLETIANEEKGHADNWRKYTEQDIGPSRLRVLWYTVLASLLGYTFVIKLMEGYEDITQEEYRQLINEIPEVQTIIDEELKHEKALIAMLDEERLQYVGSMMLGLNDALVELSGTLAGLTFALENNRLVALAGVVTGVSASLSMAASIYLAEGADGGRNALKSGLYTGAAYLIAVVCLVAPYLLFPKDMYVPAFVAMLVVAVLIIFAFTYYISVAKSQPFLARFREMVVVSVGVAAVSFVIGLLARHFLGIEV